MGWLKKLLEKLRAGLRAPGEAVAVPIGYISARVWREDKGVWEDLGVIATAEKGTI